MTFPRWRMAIATVSVAGGIVTAGLAVPAAQAARPATGPVVLVTCAQTGAVRPARFIIACADANDFLKGLSWSQWGTAPRGGGKELINSCVPSCVAGHFHTFPVKVSLSRIRNWPHHAGKRYFTRMTLKYTGAVPKGFHRTRVIQLVA